MLRYFSTANANRAIKSQGRSFRFEVVDCIGGAWAGVLSTEDPVDLEALEALTRQSTLVKEISAAEFAELLDTKKKARVSPPSPKLDQPAPAPYQDSPKIHNVPALLVENPEAAGLLAGKIDGGVKAASIDDVLKVDKVVPPEAPKPRKPRKSN